ncbi:MAG: HAMP domain-containing sensor histidine kinase [Actinomycetota bacterium]
MSSLAVRLATAFVGLVATVALVFAAIAFATASSGVTGQVDQFLRDRADELVAGDRGRPERPNRDNRQDDDRQAENRPEGDLDLPRSFDADSVVQTLDPAGSPLVSTGVALPVDNRDVELATSDKGETWLRTVETDDGPYRVITASLPDGGAVQVGRALDETNSAIGLIRGQLAVAIPVVAVMAGLAGLVLAQRITRPLRSLAASVDTVAATGDLSVPIEVDGDDEVGRLARGFDNLLQSLSHSRDQQQRLVQDAAHELRTPLTSVKANVEFLAAAPDLDPGARRDTLRSVQGELRELTRLVNEIVDVATDRYEAQAFTTVDLGHAAAEAVERFRARRPDRMIDAELPSVPVRGDHDSLVRAVGNLLSNADKYSPPGPPIAIRVGSDRVVAVADRGPGIDPADRQRVFDRFYRSDEARAQPGSGLGLSIVASIVAAHGGRIEVDDNPGGGAVVSFALPA